MSERIVTDEQRAEAARMVLDEAQRLLADPATSTANRVRLLTMLRMLASIGAVPRPEEQGEPESPA